MISKISILNSKSLNPYENLAMEEYLTFNTEEDECVLFLWQNKNTVVIGKNQNPWRECKVEKLESDGGHLVRRMSGGGAVYHDIGNLNFTFCVRKDNYDVERQLEVIIKAMALMGLEAIKTGRNDITIDGRKFSGNAFYESGDYCYHHGTILVDGNLDDMNTYLSVSEDKLKSKGVDSVKSRVTNIGTLNKDITIEKLRVVMETAFGQEYSLIPTEYDQKRINLDAVSRNEEKYQSYEWTFGRKIPFQYLMKQRFTWGDVELQLQVNGGMIQDVLCYSDGLDPDFTISVEESLKGVRYKKKDMLAAVANMDDICQLIRDEM